MIAYAAIDIRQGRCVQLIGGRPSTLRISLPDPAAVAMQWEEKGYAALHVVDLDAALGTGSNATRVAEVVERSDIPVQVGGGIRQRADVNRWLEVGAARVIVGTRAVDDEEWLRRASAENPGKIVVAADVRRGRVLSHGWEKDTGIPLDDFLQRLSGLPVAGVLVTDVGREGRVEGVDADLFRGVVRRTDRPITAAGGISSLQDLHDLDAAGVSGAVIGMALYTGAVDPFAVAREFSS